MLKKRAVSAVLWSTVEQIGATGINALFMLVLAHLLTPEDFGVVAASSLVFLFAGRLAIFGLDTVIVQRKELDTAALSTAFWTTMPLSIGLAIGATLLAPVVADIFGDSRIQSVLPFFAISMVLGTINQILTGTLRRELRMRALAKRTLIANLISGLVAVPLAYLGFGLYALVAQQVLGTMLSLVLIMLVTGWPVRFVYQRSLAAEMLRFGAPVLGADFISQYNNESPQLFVGLFLGTEALGIITIAMRAVSMLISVVGVSISRTIIPLLAEVNRTTGQVGKGFLRISRLTTAIILPSFLLLIVVREPLVNLVLGTQWLQVAPLIGLLSLAAILRTMNFLNGATAVAINRPQARFWFSLLRAVVGTLLFIAAAHIGLIAIAIAAVIRGAIVEPLQLIYLLKRLQINFKAYFATIKISIIAAMLMLFISHLLSLFVVDMTLLSQILLLGASAILTFTAFSWVANTSLRNEIVALWGARRAT